MERNFRVEFLEDAKEFLDNLPEKPVKQFTIISGNLYK